LFWSRMGGGVGGPSAGEVHTLGKLLGVTKFPHSDCEDVPGAETQVSIVAECLPGAISGVGIPGSRARPYRSAKRPPSHPVHDGNDLSLASPLSTAGRGISPYHERGRKQPSPDASQGSAIVESLQIIPAFDQLPLHSCPATRLAYADRYPPQQASRSRPD
jgi:hypothetical protein